MKCPNCLVNEAKVVQDLGPIPCDDCRLKDEVSSGEFRQLQKDASKGSWKAKKKLRSVSVHSGDGIFYWDGSRERYISYAQLADIRSRVTTHEGEFLAGKKAREYMDKYSEKYMGKNLAGSYNDTSMEGYV